MAGRDAHGVRALDGPVAQLMDDRLVPARRGGIGAGGQQSAGDAEGDDDAVAGDAAAALPVRGAVADAHARAERPCAPRGRCGRPGRRSAAASPGGCRRRGPAAGRGGCRGRGRRSRVGGGQERGDREGEDERGDGDRDQSARPRSWTEPTARTARHPFPRVRWTRETSASRPCADRTRPGGSRAMTLDSLVRLLRSPRTCPQASAPFWPASSSSVLLVCTASASASAAPATSRAAAGHAAGRSGRVHGARTSRGGGAGEARLPPVRTRPGPADDHRRHRAHEPVDDVSAGAAVAQLPRDDLRQPRRRLLHRRPVAAAVGPADGPRHRSASSARSACATRRSSAGRWAGRSG